MGKQTYQQAVTFFLDTAARVRPEQWGQPALGVWTARELVGHTMRALVTVRDYAANRPESITLDSPVAYYQAVGGLTGVHEQVAARGKEAGASLGDDPVAAVRGVADDVSALVASLPDEHPLSTRFGGIRLNDYLPTRVVELVVHTADLATALGIEPEPPAEALSEVLHLLADLAVANGRGVSLALIATGRRATPGFTVL